MIYLDTPNARPLPATDPTREAVVAALRKRGGQATCADLAADLARHSSSIRNALDKLRAQGRVERLEVRQSTATHRAVFRLVHSGDQS